jgi:hypothetical protein
MIYTFKNVKTDEVFDISLRVSEYDSYLKNNPDIIRYHAPGGTLTIVGGVGGIKNDAGWKEVLSKVAERHPSSPLGEKTLSRSSKQVKIDNIVSKYKT